MLYLLMQMGRLEFHLNLGKTLFSELEGVVESPSPEILKIQLDTLLSNLPVDLALCRRPGLNNLQIALPTSTTL